MSTHDRRIGVDVGGTFTDVVTVRDGAVSVTKVPSTPADPATGVHDGVTAAVDPDTPAAPLAHGTTVATNALLEGTWARTALVTTAGFRDVLEIGRQNRPELYDLAQDRPAPIVPRSRRLAVAERLDERGEPLERLSDDAIASVADRLREIDPEAIAVSLLFSFEDDEHERRLAAGLRDHGLEVPISRSSEIHPEIREYERSVTTAVNAALQPVLSSYLERLTARLADHVTGVTMMQSNGGTASASYLADRPVHAILSGPAAGVEGALYTATSLDTADVITMDMGGTSCDVALATDGEATTSTEVQVGPYPVAVPMVDVHTIGAGGGSVAWLDAGDALRVGPRSAGAEPGPICYGRGGTDPTVTDAQAVLGRIDPDRIATGEAVTGAALAEAVADPLPAVDDDPDAVARGILTVADAAMAGAIRVVSVERGHDPREFALVAFGGAGPLHASSIAETVGIPRVVIPPYAGVLSALGLLVADRVIDRSASHVRPLDEVNPEAVEDRCHSFEEETRATLSAEGIADDRIRTARTFDLRYLGQAYEVQVPAPATIHTATLAACADRFHEAHERRYGHAARSEPIELVTIRVRAIATVDPPQLVHEGTANRVADAVRTTRSVGFDERRETPVYERRRLPVDGRLDGPAIVEGRGSTTVIPPGQCGTVDDTGALVVEVEP